MSFILADWVWRVGFPFVLFLGRHSRFPENLRTDQDQGAV